MWLSLVSKHSAPCAMPATKACMDESSMYVRVQTLHCQHSMSMWHVSTRHPHDTRHDCTVSMHVLGTDAW